MNEMHVCIHRRTPSACYECLEERVAELESALHTYGGHLPKCLATYAMARYAPETHQCTCGFSSALGATEQEAEN